MPDGATQVLGTRLFDRIPGHIYAGLTAEQKGAIAAAAGETMPWRRHPIDIRFTLRAPFGPYYLTLVGGRERRCAARIKAERAVNPLRTARNLTFIISGSLVLYGLALATALLVSSILEY